MCEFTSNYISNINFIFTLFIKNACKRNFAGPVFCH